MYMDVSAQIAPPDDYDWEGDVPLKRYGGTSALGATLDHWMPKVLGGSSEIENLRLSCRRCNNLKADMHPRAWLELPRPKYVHQPTRYERKVAALQRCAQNSRCVTRDDVTP